MLHSIEEIIDFTPHAHGLSINIGTLSLSWFPAMKAAVALTSELGKPWVLDPVAVGASVPGLRVSPISGNAGARITSSMGNMVGGGNIGRSISSAGGLSVPGLASQLNLSVNSGSGGLNVQGQNRLTSGGLQDDSYCLRRFGPQLAAGCYEMHKKGLKSFEQSFVCDYSKRRSSSRRFPQQHAV
ncbi:hypothetical protein K1719_010532 [Acacia pycnantha]|nr:hypothetical protein K1719_010532 [Acacia pycnantha]